MTDKRRAFEEKLDAQKKEMNAKIDLLKAKANTAKADAKVICYYRDSKFSLADEKTKFQPGDEIVILTHSKNIPVLQERWQSKPSPDEPQLKE